MKNRNLLYAIYEHTDFGTITSYAKAVNRSRQYVSGVISVKYKLRIAEQERWAKLLGKPASYLFPQSDNKK